MITSDILRLNLGRHILGSSDQVYCVNEWMSHQIEQFNKIGLNDALLMKVLLDARFITAGEC